MTDQGVILHITPTPDRALSRASVKFIGASRSPNTLRAYRSDFADFQEWAGTWQLASLPATPETVSGYLSWLASTGEVTAATIDRRASAISEAHKLSHLPSPTSDETVRKTLAGIRRVLGTAPRFQKTALATDDLRAMLDHMELETLSGLRDRAILLLGFAGGFRRSELVALDVDDLGETAQGLRVRIRRSKTDQEGVGREVGIPFGRHVDTCPVKAWRAWQSAACLLKGPCFRPMNSRGGVRDRRLTAQSVALIVKAAAVTAGLEPTSYAGHSLRSGLATAAAAGGASERSIMDQTGHKSLPVVRRYIRRGSLFQDNAASHTDL